MKIISKLESIYTILKLSLAEGDEGAISVIAKN